MGSGDLISRIYSSFRGVDFRGEEINLVRSPDSLNVWKDYKETESIRTRPAVKALPIVEVPEGEEQFKFKDTIWNVSFYRDKKGNDMMLVHSGTELYKGVKSEGGYEFERIREGLNNAPSETFISNNMWYIKDGLLYLCYDGSNIWSVDGYIPTTTIGSRPLGGGKTHEDVNMLNGIRRNTFVVTEEDRTDEDGNEKESIVFHLDAQNIGFKSMEEFKVETGLGDHFDILHQIAGWVLWLAEAYKVEINGEVVETSKIKVNGGPIDPDAFENTEGYACDYNTEKGTVTISPAPPASPDGEDNVKISFYVANDYARSKILDCTLLELFDNRVFFGGNPNYPNTMWHSSLEDPTYVSDLDYYNEGLDSALIKGMVAGNNALWVFKEPSQANTTIFYHTPTIDAEYGKIYPNTHSSIATGCIGKAINFNDDILFFSDRGLEGISGDITSEQVVSHRSSLVDRKLTAEPNYKDMILAEWNGYLMCFIKTDEGSNVYLADSRAMFNNGDHGEYEFFYWQMDKKITCATVDKGILYLGTEAVDKDGEKVSGVYTLDDFTSPVESYWVTPKDKFKHPQYLKTSNKRGCVVEATTGNADNGYEGDITVYAKTDKDEGFQEIGTYENISDSFVSRIKRKKFKDIQLKFHSKTRFSLETATLECFIGGYIKR
jgi:hypothetical protein